MSAVTIQLNGEPYNLDGGSRLINLLDALALKPSRVAVEINREVVPKANYTKVVLRAGDRVEVITFVGGG